MKLQPHAAAALVTVVSITFANASFAATYDYYGPDYASGGSEVLDGGHLALTDKGTWVSASFTKGSASFDKSLVFYIDSVAGGFQNLDSFTTLGNGSQNSVTGYGGQKPVTFASGFGADYAIVLIPGNSAGLLYGLNADGTLSDAANVGLSPMDTSSGTYTFSVSYSQIGLTGAGDNAFKFESTYVNPDFAVRYAQSLENYTINGDRITFNNYDVFGVTPVPEMTNASLSIFGGIVALVGLARGLRRARKDQCRRG